MESNLLAFSSYTLFTVLFIGSLNTLSLVIGIITLLRQTTSKLKKVLLLSSIISSGLAMYLTGCLSEKILGSLLNFNYPNMVLGSIVEAFHSPAIIFIEPLMWFSFTLLVIVGLMRRDNNV